MRAGKGDRMERNQVDSSERIGVNEGRGWDGCYYADIAADFYGQVFPHRLDGYRIQRIVPSAVVHYSLRLLHLPTTNLDTIIRAFQVYNLLLLVVTVYLWNGIAGRLRLRSRGTWLGFVGLMCSFSAMKMPFYYPALTDTTAFALGAAIVYAFLAGNRVMILLAAALGAFTWPTLLYLAIPLILFPRRLAQWTSLNQPAPLAFYAAPAAAMVAMGLFRYYIKGDSPPPSAELPWRQLVPLAAACVGFYLAAATRRLLDRDVLRRLLWPFPETSALSVILCLTLVIAVKVTVWLWLVPSSPGISVRHFIKTTSLLALVKPGIFFVAHVVYFGPIVWEAVWLWSKVAQNVRSLGLGAVLAAALAILMSITSESRHLIPFIPLLVAATAWAMDSEPLCRADLGFCGLGPRSRQVLAADRRGYIQSRGQRLPRTAIFHESRSVDVRSFLSGPGHCGYLGGHGSEIVAGWKAQFQRNRVVG